MSSSLPVSGSGYSMANNTSSGKLIPSTRRQSPSVTAVLTNSKESSEARQAGTFALMLYHSSLLRPLLDSYLVTLPWLCNAFPTFLFAGLHACLNREFEANRQTCKQQIQEKIYSVLNEIIVRLNGIPPPPKRNLYTGSPGVDECNVVQHVPFFLKKIINERIL